MTKEPPREPGWPERICELCGRRTNYGIRVPTPATSEQMCECDNPGASGLFVWRRDPEWFSCVGCDGRVRPLTGREKEERATEIVVEARGLDDKLPAELRESKKRLQAARDAAKTHAGVWKLYAD